MSTNLVTFTVQTYVDKFNPILINSLSTQCLLRDRVLLRDLLLSHQVPLVDGFVVDHSKDEHAKQFKEFDDKIQVCFYDFNLG